MRVETKVHFQMAWNLVDNSKRQDNFTAHSPRTNGVKCQICHKQDTKCQSVTLSCV